MGGPKGGIGKTTVAVNIATNASRLLALRVLLVDADPNKSSLDAATAAGDAMPFSVAEGLNHEYLTKLRRSTAYDLVVIDLPGARESGALDALLREDDEEASIDGLILPTRPKLMDIRPLRRVLKTEISPLGVPFLVVLVRVDYRQTQAAEERRAEIEGWGYTVAKSYTRALDAHDDALEKHKPLLDMPGGRRSSVRAAEREYRVLSAECLEFIGIDAAALREERE
ncbi:MAG TPA: AAA family ATPase [Amycolatopsis sp.]|nr:AAA family ATPase [Amycolatopsis sp.]